MSKYLSSSEARVASDRLIGIAMIRNTGSENWIYFLIILKCYVNWLKQLLDPILWDI